MNLAKIELRGGFEWRSFAAEEDFSHFFVACWQATLPSFFVTRLFRGVGFAVFSDFSSFLPACGAFCVFPHHSLGPAPLCMLSLPAAPFPDLTCDAPLRIFIGLDT